MFLKLLPFLSKVNFPICHKSETETASSRLCLRFGSSFSNTEIKITYYREKREKPEQTVLDVNYSVNFKLFSNFQATYLKHFKNKQQFFRKYYYKLFPQDPFRHIFIVCVKKKKYVYVLNIQYIEHMLGSKLFFSSFAELFSPPFTPLNPPPK